jgi:glycosyltransferase involved in cell wall biosynthesis
MVSPRLRSGAPQTVLSVFATFAVGGPQVRFAALANRYGTRYRHLIVAMDGNVACRERLSPSLDVSFPAVPIRKGATLANMRAFRPLLRAWRPDVLVTNNWGSIEWAAANLPAVVRHVHIEDGFGPEERDRQIRRRVLIRRLALRRSTVALPSQTLVRIATETWRLDPRRIHYIPNGIDLARFSGPRDPAVAAAWPGAGPVIATVAALRAEKNLPRLLRAFAAATQASSVLPGLAGTGPMRPVAAGRRPARLVIVGDGAERAGLQALAASLGIASRVSFLGHVPEPAPLYAGFDVFGLSSDTEQMPIAVIEAMAAGLPVAATDVGDVRAMLAEANAPWVGPRDDAALAASLAALLDDAALRARIGAANRARALAAFDQERMFAAYAALFDGEPPS